MSIYTYSDMNICNLTEVFLNKLLMSVSVSLEFKYRQIFKQNEQ